MPLIFRLITLFTIGAASLALPMTCAQTGSANTAIPVISIPAAQQLDVTTTESVHLFDEQRAGHGTGMHLFDTIPMDCGKTAPRVGGQSATFDIQPFVPGYLDSTQFMWEERPYRVDSSPPAVSVDGRIRPPELPPPKAER